MAQITAKQQQLASMMESQQRDLRHPDVSEWTLTYSLREYSIPYESSDAAREDIESYIKGALCFPSCLTQKPLSGCAEYAVNSLRNQTKIFYNAATMGMGKTRLHNELCRGVMKINCGANVTTKFVRFTYSEDTDFENDGTGLTFVKQLLRYHGLAKVEADKIQTLEAGFDIFIKKLSENNAFADRTTKVLCVCFDELHQGNGAAYTQSCLVKDLMVHQDKTLKTNNEGVRVLFLFSSLTKGLFGKMTADSERTAVAPPGRVPLLDPETIKNLLLEHFPDVKRLIETKNRFVEQLVDLSSDIPRVAFDGLPVALRGFKEAQEGKKVLIRQMMEVALLEKYDTLKVQNVAEFLVHGVVERDAERLALAGLASETEAGGVRIFPLVLRAWASYYEKNAKTTKLAQFVHNAYDADCMVQENNKGIAENILQKVLQNIEAAKLCSYEMQNTQFLLRDFYRGGSTSGLSTKLHTSAFKGIYRVQPEDVADFNSDSELQDGYIVVFPRGEAAVEHLVPFQRTRTKFTVGGVQVKMIKNRPKQTLKTLAANVMNHTAMKRSGKRFPVLCTTYPRAFTWETYGVAFNRSGLETFTREFGPLRLMYEKNPRTNDEDLRCSYCSKQRTKNGRVFSDSSLRNHEAQCKKTNVNQGIKKGGKTRSA